MIKFQSYDNFSIPTDGYSFDDICIQPHIPNLTDSSITGRPLVTIDDIYDYTISITNGGSIDAVGLQLSNPIPADVSYVTDSLSATSGVATVVGSEIQWVGDVAIDETVEITFQVQVAGQVGNTIENTTMLTHPLLDPVELTASTEIVAPEPNLDYGRDGIQAMLGSDATLSQDLTLINDGFAELRWEVHETSCDAPVDIAWLEVGSTTGTTPRTENQRPSSDF